MTTRIHLDLYAPPTVNLTTDEVWPDGDAPSHPTAEQVAEIIGREGTPDDWGLISTVTVTTANPAWTGDDTLPGMPGVPRTITTTAEVHW